MESRDRVFVAILALVLLCASPAKAQGGEAGSCASSLIPCAAYVNGTEKPPKSCCDPLIQTIKTQQACLCGLLNNKGLIESLHINITQAEGLPSRCGMNVSTSSCSNSTSSSPSSGKSPSASGSRGSSQPPPAPSSAVSAVGVKGKLLAGSLLALVISFC
eukprot:TRINITY_DN10849_c0_g1_i1.p1 TRINITY_DN10849_c0_g1~~TRINITY_DN10849_c0_g1_i1.p1  ORF type:complete len:160 (+),score=3.79 TRINITY_DN10849_c0_g1_i1:125-604(+)